MNYIAIPGIVTNRMHVKSIEFLVKQAAAYFGEQWHLIKSKYRYRRLVECRIIVMNWLRKKGHSLGEIGFVFGKKDHTTVMYCLKQYNNLYDTCDNFKKQADDFNFSVN